MVLDWHHANSSNQLRTVGHFATAAPELSVSQSKVSRWIKEEKEIREKASKVSNLHACRTVTLPFPAIEEAMEIWVQQALCKGLRVNGEILRLKWCSFADHFNLPAAKTDLALSNGWLECLKRRIGLKHHIFHGEAGSLDEAVVPVERARMAEILKDWNLEDVYNADETGVFYR